RTVTTLAHPAIENTHLHYIATSDHERTRNNSEAKDAADNAARTLTALAALLPSTSTLFPEMRQLRSIIQAAQQSRSLQQQPKDLGKGLDLITTILEK